MNNPRTLRSLLDLPELTVRDLVARVAALHRGAPAIRSGHGQMVATCFEQTSTRTRTSFSVAAHRIGAGLLTLRTDELQLATGEAITDTARVLASMLDLIVVRSRRPELVEGLAAAGLAFVNAMTTEEHPTQALADLGVLLARRGELDGLSVLFLGEGNSTAAALAAGMASFAGTRLYLRCPERYGLAAEYAVRVRERGGNRFLLEEGSTMTDLPEKVDVVYTTQWQTTGDPKPDPRWREHFSPFTVTVELMSKYPDAVFMHDLPARRGEEVEAAVLDGVSSIAFEQAAAKLPAAIAVLEWCFEQAQHA